MTKKKYYQMKMILIDKVYFKKLIMILLKMDNKKILMHLNLVQYYNNMLIIKKFLILLQN